MIVSEKMLEESMARNAVQDLAMPEGNGEGNTDEGQELEMASQDRENLIAGAKEAGCFDDSGDININLKAKCFDDSGDIENLKAGAMEAGCMGGAKKTGQTRRMTFKNQERGAECKQPLNLQLQGTGKP